MELLCYPSILQFSVTQVTSARVVGAACAPGAAGAGQGWAAAAVPEAGGDRGCGGRRIRRRRSLPADTFPALPHHTDPPAA